jgi:hypothetical protein
VRKGSETGASAATALQRVEQVEVSTVFEASGGLFHADQIVDGAHQGVDSVAGGSPRDRSWTSVEVLTDTVSGFIDWCVW